MSQTMLKSNNNDVKNNGMGILFSYLYKKRKLAAKVFPHCGERGYGFSRYIQCQRLSMDSLKALKRI